MTFLVFTALRRGAAAATSRVSASTARNSTTSVVSPTIRSFSDAGDPNALPTTSMPGKTYSQDILREEATPSYMTDRSLHYSTSQPSEFELGKHRSNALELVQAQNVVLVDGPTAICDGGGGALGHPLEYIHVANNGGKAVPCIYCGLKYAQKPHH